jgi:ABC-type microcin C transport system permease subunit YejE
MLKNRIFIIDKFFIFLFLFSLSIFAEEQRRDPFISLVTEDGRLITFKEKKKDELEVEGILYDPYGRASAIVNSQIVRIGDWIGEYQVYRIEKDRVIFLKEGKEFIVKLEKEEEK